MGFKLYKYRPYHHNYRNFGVKGGGVRLQESQNLSSSKHFHTNIEINGWEIFCEDKEQNILDKMLFCKKQFDWLIKYSALNLKSKERRLGEKQRKDADDYLKAFKILHKRLKQHRNGDL